MKSKIKKLYFLVKDFGIVFASKNIYYRETCQYDNYIKLIYDFLCEYLADMISEYSKVEVNDNIILDNEKKKVWVCWWQGYSNMPELCKICYNHLKSILSDQYELILVTKDNYGQYTSLPSYIIDKLNAGNIPVTQFCDILRQSLIYYNGGLWIDASIWCTDNINKQLEFDSEFWSVKLEAIDDPGVYGQLISDCKWGSFLLGGKKGSLVYKFVFEAMCKYYKDYTYVIDYFLQNMLIKVGYENIPYIAKLIDDVEISNSHIYELYRYMDSPYDERVWEKITEDTSFFKLTQKRPYLSEVNGQKTFYTFLKEQEGHKDE